MDSKKRNSGKNEKISYTQYQKLSQVDVPTAGLLFDFVLDGDGALFFLPDAAALLWRPLRARDPPGGGAERERPPPSPAAVERLLLEVFPAADFFFIFTVIVCPCFKL